MLEQKPMDLKTQVFEHRQRFKEIFKARYMEILPSLIFYKNFKDVSVDFMKVEIALRSNYDVVIGQAKTPQGTINIQVIGYANSNLTKNDPSDLFSTHGLKQSAINFVIKDEFKMPHYEEISFDDECQTGNFVVIRNKSHNYVSDMLILDHYVDELAEIVLSRYSLSMQVKINTIFMGEPNDTTIEEMVQDIYAGNPYIKATKLFDPNDQIYHFENSGVAANFQELKREYQNKIGELNNMLGMNSLAVEKSSGVSDEEAQSNRSYTTSNANIYLDARNNGLQRLNKRFGLALEALYNDEVVSEFQEIENANEAAEAKGEVSHDNPV